MGTKYTTQSISGYNATPPADDGTAIESNKIKWATHKDKLADPIKILAEAIDSALVTYVDRQPLAKSTAYTTVLTDHLRTIETTGTTTITLGAVASMGTGYTVTVKNAGAGVVTVEGSGSETIDGDLNTTLAVDQAKTFVVDNAGGAYLVQSNMAEIGTGATGTVLTGQGTGVTPTFETPKDSVKDWGSVSTATSIDLEDADFHVVECTASLTLTFASANTNDKATVAIHNTGSYTITVAGIDNNSPTLTVGTNIQDFIGLVKSHGKITAVAFVDNEAAV